MHTISIRCLLPISVLVLMLGACTSRPSQPAQEINVAPTAPLPSATPQAATPATQPRTTTTAESSIANTTPSPATRVGQQALFLGADGKLQAATTTNRAIAIIATLPANAEVIALSPNGESLAFVHDGQLLVRALDTATDTHLVSATPAASDVAFSPDGHNLLYAIDTSDDPLNQPQPQLYLSHLDGQPDRLLGSGFAPVWSPMGDQVAFLGAPFEGSPAFGGGPGGRLTIAARDGSNQHPVGEGEAVHPAWQPIIWSSDGTRLAAGAQLIDATSGTVIARGPETKNIVVSGIQSISPDGHSFAYWRNVRSGDAQSDTFTEHDELLMVSDDGQSHLIAQTSPRACPCLHLVGQLRPVWTPDGDRFVVTDPRLSVRLYTPNGLPIGGQHVPKGTQIGDVFNGAVPFWADDGEALLVSLVADKHDETWILHTRDGTWRRLGTGVALGWRN